VTARRELGKTRLLISPVGLGCWQLSRGRGIGGKFWPALDEGTEREIVRVSIEGGVNWFDTAEFYGNGASERALSEALKPLESWPEDLLIATKWTPLLRFASHLRSSVSKRLAALDGLRIDLHQVHSRGSLSSIAAQMNAMADLVEERRIRSVGVSNFGARAMRTAHEALRKRGIPLASNQVAYNLLDRRIERNGVLETARELGITIIAYSPLAMGVLTGKFHGDPGLLERAGGLRRRLRPFRPDSLQRSRPLIEVLAAVGTAHGALPAQVALSWVTSFHGDQVVAIPGARTGEQARLNAESMRLELSNSDLERIDSASRRTQAQR
jgi:aryl-alcohol dehydrogenase-like predicted oxidoreductase